MNTKTIKDILKSKFLKGNSFSQDELNEVTSLSIDQFDIAGNIIPVDYDDLLLFNNLKTLSIKNCILTDTFFNNISKINNLFIYNCEFQIINESFFSLHFLNSLLISGKNFQIKNIDNITLNKLTLEYVNIEEYFTVNLDTLDVKKCKVKNWDFLNNNINTIVISYDQYYDNINLFNNSNLHIIIMEKNNQFIHKEVNING